MPLWPALLQRKAQSCLTWGEISKENIVVLLSKRGRLAGNKRLTDEYAKELGYKSLDELAEAIHKAKWNIIGCRG